MTRQLVLMVAGLLAWCAAIVVASVAFTLSLGPLAAVLIVWPIAAGGGFIVFRALWGRLLP